MDIKISVKKEDQDIIITKTVIVENETFQGTKKIPYSEAVEIFKYFYNKILIKRSKKTSCHCIDGAYDNCEVCCPDSFSDYIFEDELKG